MREANDIGRQRQTDKEVQEIAGDLAGYEVTRTSSGVIGPPTQPVVLYAQVKASESWAAMLLEEMVEGVEAIHPWSVPVVRRAIAKLPPAQRQVITYLSEKDFDYNKNDLSVLSREGGRALGIRAEAFRKNKQRAYESLRRLIPEVIVELGINLPRRIEESVFEERRGGPDEDAR